MQSLLRSSHFDVVDQTCRHPRVNCGHTEGEPARFVFTRRGAFAFRAGGRTYHASPGQVVLVRKDVAFHVSHPDAHSCDRCTDVRVSDALLDMLGMDADMRQPCRVFAHDHWFQRMHLEIFMGLQEPQTQAERGDEVLLEALACLLQPHVGGQWASVQDPCALQQVAWVQEAILADVGTNAGLDALAAIAGCSPFHLIRIFQNSTGRSPHQFRIQHRLGTALTRIVEGDEDFASMSLQLGFCSHSHFSSVFRRAYGITPREVRLYVGKIGLQGLHERLRARLAPGSGTSLSRH